MAFRDTFLLSIVGAAGKALFVAALTPLVTGCELIASVDRAEIEEPSAAAGSSSSSATGERRLRR
jgi:hypothetical protein